MTCQQREADVVELARGATIDGDAELELRRHLVGCPACAARFERERQLTAGLRALAAAATVPGNDVAERWLLEAFASRVSASGSSRRLTPVTHWSALAAAASLLFFLGYWAAIEWRRTATTSQPVTGSTQVAPAPHQPQSQPGERVASVAAPPASVETSGRVVPKPRTRRAVLAGESPAGADRLAGFVLLPAADGLPGFDSGMIVRVALPTASLPAFGLAIAPEATQTVNAEVLVGQDGQARAIRLVSLVGGSRREPQ